VDDTPRRTYHRNPNEYDQPSAIVKTDSHLIAHITGQSSMPDKNSKECFAFPQQLSSMNTSVFSGLRFGENEENQLNYLHSQG